ncbi:MAG: hypothetical protein KJ970_15450 [Candidatus Eisenbacteria bacterium]|uniref:Uncharacterized protein n=1 Tax=Eiseniibacteriota bacterium TaxID=2212470 RepID=A0A948W4K3_UNCEI|nr:hypothetical protein [Candidatus Eisenbacteria bacterium]MBU1949690.1 hypothetical protein [Candidatus Eisenbacteria bacterium]MBU2692317.1 hypothetical protein [Candidatus Eisenbacteria bacterium]
MKDTPSAVQARFHRQLLARSAEERLGMACRMFSTAKKLAQAAIDKTGIRSRSEINVMLFLRMYGQDFGEAERNKILAWLRATEPR